MALIVLDAIQKIARWMLARFDCRSARTPLLILSGNQRLDAVKMTQRPFAPESGSDPKSLKLSAARKIRASKHTHIAELLSVTKLAIADVHRIGFGREERQELIEARPGFHFHRCSSSHCHWFLESSLDTFLPTKQIHSNCREVRGLFPKSRVGV